MGGLLWGPARFGASCHALRCSLFKERCSCRMPLVRVIQSYPRRQLCSGASYESINRTHIHRCIKLSGNPVDYKELVRENWLDAGGVCGDPDVYDRDDDRWFTEIVTPAVMRKHVNYSLKQCCSDTQPVHWNFARNIRTA